MTKELVLNQQSIAIADPTFGGAVGDNGLLIGVRRFVALKLGVTLREGETFKELKARLTPEQIPLCKPLSKEFDGHRVEFYTASKKMAALAAADPSMRAETRIVTGKNGIIGVNVKHRFEKASSPTGATARAVAAERRVKELEAQMASIIAKLGLTA